MDKFISLNTFSQGLIFGFILGRLSYDLFPKKPKLDDNIAPTGMFFYRYNQKPPHHF